MASRWVFQRDAYLLYMACLINDCKKLGAINTLVPEDEITVA